MKEEDEIFKKVGNGNAFKVPENYFENLTSEVMSKLPEKDNATPMKKEARKWDKIKPLLYMAAMFVGAALIIKVASIELGTTLSSGQVETGNAEIVSDQYISEVVNGAMMDDYSLHVYLTESNGEIGRAHV